MNTVEAPRQYTDKQRIGKGWYTTQTLNLLPDRRIGRQTGTLKSACNTTTHKQVKQKDNTTVIFAPFKLASNEMALSDAKRIVRENK